MRAATSAFIPDQKLPYSINYNLTVEHVFAKDYTLDVGYIGTKGVHLISQEQLNRQSPVTATQNIPTFLSTPSAATLAGLPLNLGQLQAIGDQVPAYANAGFTASVTFVLVWMGGMATSKGYGLAVPDWPNTYGYNMFFFPPSKWIGGILFEHSQIIIDALNLVKNIFRFLFIPIKNGRVIGHTRFF